MIIPLPNQARISLTEIERRAAEWGAAHGHTQSKGGWVYCKDRIVAPDWLVVYEEYRAEIDLWRGRLT